MREERAVRLTVTGIQNGQRTVTETSARLARAEDGSYELYWTVFGEGREEIRYTAVLNRNDSPLEDPAAGSYRLRIRQRGAVHCEMDLRGGETTHCEYETLMGTIPMDLRTSKVTMRESPRSLLVRAAYTILPGEIENTVTMRAEYLPRREERPSGC